MLLRKFETRPGEGGQVVSRDMTDTPPLVPEADPLADAKAWLATMTSTIARLGQARSGNAPAPRSPAAEPAPLGKVPPSQN
jgi:hypothetical protein